MKLALWMKRAELTDKEVAQKLQESPHTVKKWRLGYTAPTRRKMPKLMRLTKNEVQSDDFLDFRPAAQQIRNRRTGRLTKAKKRS